MTNSATPEPLFIRLYLDRHIKLRLAEDLRASGYDVRTTQEAGMDTATDEEQLLYATGELRAILTFNIRDFAPLHEEWTTAGRTHGGIIVSRQLGSREYGLLLSRMVRLLDQLTAEEMRGNLVHLEQFKA
jgi:predicted nuclease of predicted toxin-antitoxin system